MKDITVFDDFFNEKELNILQNNLNKIKWDHAKNKEKEQYGFTHKFFPSKENQWLFNKIKKIFFKKKNLKLIECSFRIRHNSEIMPHQDDHVNYLFLCYLKGKELMYNGTGFYNDKKNLDRYIGFKENRAMFFNSHIVHTDLQALGESSPRYSLNIFYKYDK